MTPGPAADIAGLVIGAADGCNGVGGWTPAGAGGRAVDGAGGCGEGLAGGVATWASPGFGGCDSGAG